MGHTGIESPISIPKLEHTTLVASTEAGASHGIAACSPNCKPSGKCFEKSHTHGEHSLAQTGTFLIAIEAVKSVEVKKKLST